jgi:hypothetical protein
MDDDCIVKETSSEATYEAWGIRCVSCAGFAEWYTEANLSKNASRDTLSLELFCSDSEVTWCQGQWKLNKCRRQRIPRRTLPKLLRSYQLPLDDVTCG